MYSQSPKQKPGLPSSAVSFAEILAAAPRSKSPACAVNRTAKLLEVRQVCSLSTVLLGEGDLSAD